MRAQGLYSQLYKFYLKKEKDVNHLSGYLGIPTIALYKTTDPKGWGVLGRKVVHISAVNEEFTSSKIRECLERM
ncbi:MAG: hypothetical protein ACE5GU_13310, partial [Candidatus Scalinduaceae bacterium]